MVRAARRGWSSVLRYTAVVLHQPGTGYTAVVPLVPGCAGTGATAAAALAAARRLLALHLACLLDDGKPIPWEGEAPTLAPLEIPEALLD
jgi:predicted RNase H-like HicB family nuclease